MAVTREHIVGAVRMLGVRGGDWMIVHSSYKSIGGVDGGPAAVAQAMVDIVSPGAGGSVFMPTFNYGRDPYDPATAPSLDGVITEFFRQRPDAIRSRHPTHPIAGVGPDAAAILDGHDRVEPFGRASPCWRLWERDAWVLLVGVDHAANSMAHVAEEMLDMPYLDRRRTARVVQADGSIAKVTIRRPGCSDAWGPVIDPPLRARGAIVAGTLGQARVMLMRSKTVVDVTANLLRADPAALLCHQPRCEACNQARQMLAKK